MSYHVRRRVRIFRLTGRNIEARANKILGGLTEPGWRVTYQPGKNTLNIIAELDDLEEDGPAIPTRRRRT